MDRPLFLTTPGGIITAAQSLPAYLRPQVRLETGARSEDWPAEDKAVLPYAAETHRDLFRAPHSTVHVLTASRTFCEKLTVLRACHHSLTSRPLRDRQLRHYFDVVKLYETGIGKTVLQDANLLRAVASHQAAFFRSRWANDDEAVPGTLRLVPPESRRAEFEEDYEKMKEPIFGEPPSFAHILEVLAQVERAANSGS